MNEKLEYLNCLRNEIINGQKSRNAIITLKVTAMAAIISYSLNGNSKGIIVFTFLIAVVLDYLIYGITLMITSISDYIVENIESSFLPSYLGWETYIRKNPKIIKKGKLIAMLASGPGLTLVILFISLYALMQISSDTISNILIYWIVLIVSLIGWLSLIIMIVSTPAEKNNN